jgi:hypothetical protein
VVEQSLQGDEVEGILDEDQDVSQRRRARELGIELASHPGLKAPGVGVVVEPPVIRDDAILGAEKAVEGGQNADAGSTGRVPATNPRK